MRKYFILFLIISLQSAGQKFSQVIKKTENFHLFGEIDSVKKYANISLQLAKVESDDLAENKAQYFLIIPILRTNPDSALKVMNNLFLKFEAKNEAKYLSYLSTSYGQYYRRMGNFEKAIQSHKKAIDYAENHYLKNETELLPRIIASQYNSIAVINFDRSEYDLSNQFALKALKIANQHNIRAITDNGGARKCYQFGRTQPRSVKQFDQCRESVIERRRFGPRQPLFDHFEQRLHLLLVKHLGQAALLHRTG